MSAKFARALRAVSAAAIAAMLAAQALPAAATATAATAATAAATAATAEAAAGAAATAATAKVATVAPVAPAVATVATAQEPASIISEVAAEESPQEPQPGSPGALSVRDTNLTAQQKAEMLAELGLLKGDAQNGLMLDSKVRRSEAATFFTRLLGEEQDVLAGAASEYAQTPFPDVAAGQWYTPYISYCASIGLIGGRPDGKYYPDDTITEKEFAHLLLEILGYIYTVDYEWGTVYEFAYDIGLFNDSSYATKKDDSADFYRLDSCELIFTALELEKKDSALLLIEDLAERGAVAEDAALGLGYSLDGLYGGGGAKPLDEYADIEAVYHAEPDLLWVVFTQNVSFDAGSVEITETFDISKPLALTVESVYTRSALIRTGAQTPRMEYTIDISNVVGADGANAGMLSCDFVGFDPSAAADTPAGLTTRSGVDGGAGEPAPGSAGSAAAGTQGGAGGVLGGAGQAGPDAGVEYFRIVNAYTVSSSQVAVYFSQPISETAENPPLYSIYRDGAVIASGEAGQISAELLRTANNVITLTAPGVSFVKDASYQVAASGRLTSSYTAKLNEGFDDIYSFKAAQVQPQEDGFSVTSITTPSQYIVELKFTQPVNAGVTSQVYNYFITDQNGKRVDVSTVNYPNSGGSAAGGAAAAAAGSDTVRLNIVQPFVALQQYSLTIVYAQNEAKTANIANLSFPFQFNAGGGAQKSDIAVTGAVSNDPATVEVHFDRRPDAASAAVVSNYSVSGVFGSNKYSSAATPIKVAHDPVLSPYTVRLFFAQDVRLVKDTAYTLKVYQSLLDENRAAPPGTIEMQFYATNQQMSAPGIRDAAIVGENIVKLSFSKEILLDSRNIAESNFALEETVNGITAQNAAINPMLVKYVDPLTMVLIFDGLDASKAYRIRASSLIDYSGQYTLNYPEQGSVVPLREGKRN
jgi:hypothetical protein